MLVELSLCFCGDCYHLSSSGLVIVVLGQSTFTESDVLSSHWLMWLF